MKIRLLLTLCCVSFLSGNVFAEGDDGIKKGHFPFMAFIYYPDEAVIEATGARFLRGAVLVKPEWLITSSVGPVTINDTPTGFPRKTLLARLGSISIDANFTLNEDEDEQEREVIQLIRPHNYSEAQWWRNDITLMKTLLPFNMTATVGPANLRTKPGIISNSNCFMLVYAKKFANVTEEKVLMQLFVELQTSKESCGNHFYEQTMLCASDSDDIKNAVHDPEFCRGNSGGPLVCENEVTGLQAYIENNCKQPYLYQLLSAWDSFITCAVEDKCNEEHCSNVCTIINKDEPVTLDSTTLGEEQHIVDLISAVPVAQTETEEISTFFHAPAELTPDEYDGPTHSVITPALELNITVDTTLTTTTTAPTMEPVMPTKKSENPLSDEMETKSWPRDKYPDRVKTSQEEEVKIERKTNVEAQKQTIVSKKRSAADRNTSAPTSLLFQFVLASLIM